jgi:hypothetical protein
MELNESTMMTNSSWSLTTQSVVNHSTTTVFYSDRLFLHTVACQAIAGAFTWAAIFITSYHVKRERSVAFHLPSAILV